MGYASSAMSTCRASRSASEYTATVAMPCSRHSRMTRVAISPRFATRTLRRAGTRALLAHGADGGLEKGRVHDLLERDHALREPVLLPPHHLLLDVRDPEPPVPVLIRKSDAHHRRRRARVLRGDGEHLVVVRPRRQSPVFLHEHVVEVVARGFHVPLHEVDGLRLV